MNRRGSSLDRRLALIAIALLGAFAFSLALAASPQLHARFHPDAGNADHTCAAVLIASGNVHHAAPPPLFDSFASAFSQDYVLPRAPQSAVPVFLTAAIFEHAPPARNS